MTIKLIAYVFVCFSFGVALSQHQNFSEWKKQQDEAYRRWEQTQDWEHNYIDWQQTADKEYTRWQQESGWTEQNDTPSSFFPDKQMLNVPANSSAELSELQKSLERLKAENEELRQNQSTADTEELRQNQITELQSQIARLQKQNTSSNALNNKRPSKKIKIWAVIVGVSNYTKKEAKLNYCDDDAYRIYAFLKSPAGGSIPDKRIILLIDEEATGDRIQNALETLSEKADSEDVFLFYFSGHGTPDALLAHDFANHSPDVVDHNTIRQFIDNSNSNFIYCIIDACHSAAIAVDEEANNVTLSGSRGKKSVENLEKSEPFYTALSTIKQKGNVFILSSKKNETSVELGGKRQGLFSYFLIKGLSGEADYNHDNVVSITEVFNYTREKVKDHSKNEQTPVISGDYDHRMPMSVIISE